MQVYHYVIMQANDGHHQPLMLEPALLLSASEGPACRLYSNGRALAHTHAYTSTFTTLTASNNSTKGQTCVLPSILSPETFSNTPCLRDMYSPSQ